MAEDESSLIALSCFRVFFFVSLAHLSAGKPRLVSPLLNCLNWHSFSTFYFKTFINCAFLLAFSGSLMPCNAIVFAVRSCSESYCYTLFRLQSRMFCFIVQLKECILGVNGESSCMFCAMPLKTEVNCKNITQMNTQITSHVCENSCISSLKHTNAPNLQGCKHTNNLEI